jgi:hypothetical protein
MLDVEREWLMSRSVRSMALLLASKDPTYMALCLSFRIGLIPDHDDDVMDEQK